jgi:glycosyltransferase involved in cell wall biosynthesis
MTVSVIIPTFKPSDSVYLSIESVVRQNTPCQTIVVENGSCTEKLKDFCDTKRVDYIHMEEAGANLARNYGAAHADHDLLLFTDDDCLLAPDCVSQHIQAHVRYPNSVIGGRVILGGFADDSIRPKWLGQPFRKALAEVDWHKQIKPEPLSGEVDVSNGLLYLVTANMSVNKDLFNSAGCFDDGAGYIGNRPTPNDEHGFLDLVRGLGTGVSLGHVIYSSLPVVNHQVTKERVTIEYFKKRFWGQGWADGRLFERQIGDRDKAMRACFDDILRKGSVANQLNNEEWQTNEKDIAIEFSKNLYVCTACYMKGVLDYFNEFENDGGVCS